MGPLRVRYCAVQSAEGIDEAHLPCLIAGPDASPRDLFDVVNREGPSGGYYGLEVLVVIQDHSFDVFLCARCERRQEMHPGGMTAMGIIITGDAETFCEFTSIEFDPEDSNAPGVRRWIREYLFQVHRDVVSAAGSGI